MKIIEDTMPKITIHCTRHELWKNYLDFLKDCPTGYFTVGVVDGFRQVGNALDGEFNETALIDLFRDSFAPILLGDAMRKFDAPVYRTVAIYDEDVPEQVVYINHEDIIF